MPKHENNFLKKSLAQNQKWPRNGRSNGRQPFSGGGGGFPKSPKNCRANGRICGKNGRRPFRWPFLRNGNSAQRGSVWPDIPADIRPKTSVRPSKSEKNKHFGTDIPRGRPQKNFGLKNFGLIFRSLISRPFLVLNRFPIL